jgi:hypothetical protein
VVVNSKTIVIFLFLAGLYLACHAEETNPQVVSFSITGYIDAQDDIKSDYDLDITSFTVKSFTTTTWGQRLGGGVTLVASSSDLNEEEENKYLYGGFFAGFLLGQELRIWQIILGINVFLGAGGSISNIWTSPRHVDYFGEITVDAGFIIMDTVYLSGFTGFQTIGNLFPQLPGTAYFMYYPVWGITLTF